MFNCDKAKFINNNQLYIDVDGVRVIYTVNFSLGIVQEIVLKSTNYNSLCRIVFDARKRKVVHLKCTGFNDAKVEKIIRECFKQLGIIQEKV